MKIIPNTYLDLTIICDQCCFPVINAHTRLAKRCCMPGIFHPKNKSPCQKSAHKQSAKKTRNKQQGEEGKLYQNKAFKDTGHQAMRGCLRCEPDNNGVIPKFLSMGKGHRICPACSRKEAGINVEGFSELRSKIPNLPPGIALNWEPGSD